MYIYQTSIKLQRRCREKWNVVQHTTGLPFYIVNFGVSVGLPSNIKTQGGFDLLIGQWPRGNEVVWTVLVRWGDPARPRDLGSVFADLARKDEVFVLLAAPSVPFGVHIARTRLAA